MDSITALRYKLLSTDEMLRDGNDRYRVAYRHVHLSSGRTVTINGTMERADYRYKKSPLVFRARSIASTKKEPWVLAIGYVESKALLKAKLNEYAQDVLDGFTELEWDTEE